MCYDDLAQPPLPPGQTETTTSEDLVLTASDGNRLSAFAAYPTRPAKALVAIFGDAGGLSPFYRSLAIRFAEVGIAAIAMDHYGRSAGLATVRDGSFDFMPHLRQLTLHGLLADSEAALNYLRSQVNPPTATFTVGFCMGGALSFLNGVGDVRLAGVIGFYAFSGKAAFFDDHSFLDSTEQITCPVLGLFGDADTVIPVSDVQLFDERLDTAGVEHEIVLYADAPHGFFELGRPEFADASANAWERVLAFIERHASSTQEMRFQA